MLILPHSAELRMVNIPWVTLTIILLCTVVHYFQEISREVVYEAAHRYCVVPEHSIGFKVVSLQDEYAESDVCESLLRLVHQVPDPLWAMDRIEESMLDMDGLSTEDRNILLAQLREHYPAFQASAPSSLDAKLVTDPSFPNPLRFLTATFSHADWWHLVGNMIFYFAFAAALELIIGNAWRYVAVILMTGLAASAVYYLTSQLGGDGVPSLGYSGVVMGMIGLSAYLMPKAKIRTFVWFLYFAKNLQIPAWVLAVWYIGWDTYDLIRLGQHTGIALTAHLGGAAAGYGLGWAWFRERKAEIAEELADEIEYMRARRADRLGIMSSYTGGQSRIQQEEQERQRRMTYDRLLDRLHNRARTGRSGEAVALLSAELDTLGDTVTTWQELFEVVSSWRHSRFRSCVARALVDRLCEVHRYTESLTVVDEALQQDERFVLGDPSHLPDLAEAAMEVGRYKLAFTLVRDSAQRYPQWQGGIDAQLMEARLLFEHLSKPVEARAILENLLRDSRYSSNRRLISLADAMIG